jgi:anti-anti-sigma factor
MEIIKNADGIIYLKGELNIYKSKELKKYLENELKKSPKQIKLELSGVTDIDTSCIQILLSLKKLAKTENIYYKLINPAIVVKEAFKLAGLIKKE